MEGTHAMSSSSLPTRGNYKAGEPGALILIIPADQVQGHLPAMAGRI